MDEPRLFVRCQKGGDMAVLPLKYEFEVSSEGSNREYIPEYIRPLHGHLRTWGTTAQGIYRLGDEVQFKIYVRDQDNRGFSAAPRSGYQLQIKDAMDKVIHEQSDLGLSDFGALQGTFSIPKNGAIGWYRALLKPSFGEEELEPMRFLVSDFNPAPFKVTTEVNGERFGIGDRVTATTLAKLHAGGPFAGAAAKLTATVESRPFELSDARVRGFQFDAFARPKEGYETPKVQTLFEGDGALNDAGLMENQFTVTETPVFNGKLTVESAVRDDRGKTIADRVSAAYLGRDRFVGLSQGDWTLTENRPGKVRFAVIDPEGKPVAGVPVQVQGRAQTDPGLSRKRGRERLPHSFCPRVAGRGFFFESGFRRRPETASSSRPGAAAAIASRRASPIPGEDPRNDHRTRGLSANAMSFGSRRQATCSTSSRKRENYQVGDTARVLVQNPFPGAQALITIERFGVIKSWVKKLSNSTEMIELPILPEYLPGFYVSVMVVSPRVEKPSAEDGMTDAGDLGKPTFRMGYAQITVSDPYKQINVRAQADKEVYKPRETVTVDLAAQLRNPVPETADQPIELAVVVLDESVLDLLKEGKDDV